MGVEKNGSNAYEITTQPKTCNKVKIINPPDMKD